MLNMIERVQNDYFMFEKLMLVTSKQNIYDKAAEIFEKKQIVLEMTQLEYSDENTYALYAIDGLLDYIYLVKQEKGVSTKEALRYIVEMAKEA